MYRLNKVSFGYDDHPIFHNLSVDFPEHGLVIILGKSGCGKTTLLSLLCGVLKPQSGSVEGFFEARPALVFQSPLLLSYLNVQENVLLSTILNGDKARVDSVLHQVGLDGFEKKEIQKMSGGEQMRVSIARALLTDSPVLILDEPTGQLDEKCSLEIYRILKELSDDHLLIMVTHDEKNALELADQLYLMEEGNLILKKGSVCSKTTLRTNRRSFGHIHLRDSSLLAKRYLKKKRTRVLLATIFLSFIMTLIYLGLNLKSALPTTVNAFLKEYYAYEVNTISIKESIAENGRLHLERYSVPSDEQLVILNIEESYTPLTYFLPTINSITIHNKSVAVSFYPFFHQSQQKLKYGRTSKSANEVIVNQNFLNEFNLTEKDFHQAIHLSSTALIRSISLTASDLVSLEDTFEIVGVSKEKKAFNQPIIYYSYFDYYDRLSQEYLKNISEELDKLTSITDLLNDAKYDDDDFKGQGKLFLKENIDEQLKVSKSRYPGKVKISSQALSLKESTSTLLDSLTQVLLLFLGLNLISAFMLEFLIVYSLYEENLRLYALEKAFKASKKTRVSVVMGLQFQLLKRVIFFLLFGCLASTITINFILSKLDMPPFLTLFHPGLFLLVLTASVIISFLASLLPFYRIKDSELKKELEGED